MLAQLQAAWRTAGLLAGAPKGLTDTRDTIERHRNRRVARDALTTLRANLSFGSTAFRHALRLAATICVAQALATALELPRGYWVALTVAVMLKPDFQDTLSACISQVGGTALGLVGVVALANTMSPGSVPSVAIILAFSWAVYAVAAVNPVAFTVCLTG